MKTKAIFALKQAMKMVLQNAILPSVYSFWASIYRNREPDLIILADAHHETMPYSMERIHSALLAKGYEVKEVICDFSTMSLLRSTLISIGFMRLYAKARYVFICDNFLPVSSCKKRKETTVIQLMHSCGLFKKMGYDTKDDIPEYYRGEVYSNYDLVTVSAPCCVEPLSKAMHQAEEVVKALGISRTDNYFDQSWIDACRNRFYAQHPEALGKRIILWAPTFRGNAGNPYQIGLEEISDLERELGDAFCVIKKVHPHVDKVYHLSNCDMATEELFPVTDLLISDYSSVVNEFMFFDKPYVLFAPDIEEFEANRGFYVPYKSLTPYVCTLKEKVKETIFSALSEEKHDWVKAQRDFHLAACDGNATQRILDNLEL